MSLSNPRSSSPVTRYFRISSSAGNLNYWDKAAAAEVIVPLEFRFIVLDSLATARGYHEASGSAIFANEVRSNTDVLNVRSKTGTLISGGWTEIKDRARALGARYARSLYLAYLDGNEWKLGNLTVVGASASSWFDFEKSGGGKDSDPGVALTGFEPRRKGATNYHAPIFNRWTVGESDLQAASALDRVLQDHLRTSLSRTSEPEPLATSPEPPAPSFSASAPF